MLCKAVLFGALCLSAFQAVAQQNPLVEAAKTGDIIKVKSLLKAGSPVTGHGPNGRTALHEAANSGNAELFQVLISFGADIHAKDNSGITPEFIVLHTPNNETRNAMIRAFPKDSAPSAQQQPWTLEYAISHRQPTVVAMLLDLHANANAIDVNGDYPLDLAAQKGDSEIVQLLLGHGADVNLGTKTGSLPIHTAALFGHLKVVDLLLAKGADVNAVDSTTGQTPLHYAASFGRTDIIRVLLEHGANRNIADKAGFTPLAAALKAGQADAANLLK